jgi:festuclavine dehydrogenase
MAIIVTGGTGMTGIRLAALLKDANIPFVLTSRRGPAAAPGMPVVEFAWGDARTFPNPFKHFSEKVSGIYIIGPDSHPSAAASVNSFIDYAVKEHGVRRFILAGGTLLQKGGHLEMGKVWEHLDDIGVEYGALRLTWFMGMPPSNIFIVNWGSCRPTA